VGGEQDLPPVDHVGDHTGRQREQQDRQRRGSGHQPDPQRRAGLLEHQPRGGDGVDQAADVAAEPREPEGAETADAKRLHA
jgi:hypothetical protein